MEYDFVISLEKKPPPKDEDPSLMNYGTESESDIGLSEEDIAGYDERLDESLDKPTTSSYEPPLLDPGPSLAVFSTSKRKNEFEDIELAQSTSKKCKNDGECSIEEFEDQNHLQSSELEDDEEDEFMESLVREKGLIGEIDEQLMRDTVGENSGTVSQRARLHSENEDSEYDSEEDSEGEDPIRKLPSSVSVIDTDKTDFIEKLASELGEPSCSKSEEDKISTEDYNYDITEKLKEMGKNLFYLFIIDNNNIFIFILKRALISSTFIWNIFFSLPPLFIKTIAILYWF